MVDKLQHKKSLYSNSASLFEVLRVLFPENVETWDGHNYSVHGPLSLDDEAYIQVRLENKGGLTTTVILPLVGVENALRERGENPHGASDTTRATGSAGNDGLLCDGPVRRGGVPKRTD